MAGLGLQRGGAHCMSEPTLEQALVRIEGALAVVPDGFENPQEGRDALFVHEVPILPCGLDDGLDAVVCDLQAIRAALLNEQVSTRCLAVLHLQVSTPADDGYLLIKLPKTFLLFLAETGLGLEIADYRM